jgi:hypothetical protein
LFVFVEHCFFFLITIKKIEEAMFTPESEGYEPAIITGTPTRGGEGIRRWEPAIKENIGTTTPTNNRSKYLYQKVSNHNINNKNNIYLLYSLLVLLAFISNQRLLSNGIATTLH